MNNKHKPKYISVEPLTLTQAITNLFNEMSPRDYMAAPEYHRLFEKMKLTKDIK